MSKYNFYWIFAIVIIVCIGIYCVRRENYFEDNNVIGRKWTKQEIQNFVNILPPICSATPEKKDKTLQCILKKAQEYNSPEDILSPILTEIIQDCMSKNQCKNLLSNDSPPGGWNADQLRQLEMIFNKAEMNPTIKKCLLKKVPSKYSFMDWMQKLSDNHPDCSLEAKSCAK